MIFLLLAFMLPVLILIFCEKKSKKFLIVILGIHAVIIFFALYLGWFFMGIIYIMVFMWIVSFRIISSMNRVF